MPSRPHAALVASLLIAAVAQLRAGPPSPAAIDAPEDQFSATRAHAILRDLLGDERPHPVGSAANDAVRERLLAQLRQLGLEPEQQRAFVCNTRGSCATVTNVIAWLPGQVPGPALALTSHYDSVGAGPGAADDGHGVALILETLRVLRTQPRHGPLVAVFTDGEEAGLLGAQAFAEQHPQAAEIGVAINVEARGTTGAARMFETSDNNAALIAAYAESPRPSALSLSYEIYRRLPNDTDLTIFKRHGMQGVGFAFIGGVQRYHTPRDDLAHLDLGSVQQQGDAVVATAQALLTTALPPPAPHNAHYADLFAATLLRWPGWLDLPLALAALLALIVTAVRRRQALPIRRLAVALASPLLVVLAATSAAFALHWLIEALTGPLGPWPATGAWPVLALAAAASAAALVTLRPLARHVGPLAQTLGVWLVWTVLALALAVAIPGASILLLAPAAVAAIAPGSRRGPALAAAIAVALWAPVAPVLSEALGLSALLVGAAVGWLWTALAPTCAEEHGSKTLSVCTWLFALVATVAAAVAGFGPRFDVDHPARVNLLHLTDLDAGVAWHLAEAPSGLPAPLLGALDWDHSRALLPWSGRPVPSASAAMHSEAGPSLTANVRTSPGRANLTLHTRPGALAALLIVPDGSVSSLTIGGQPLDPRSMRPGPSDTRIAMIFGPPAEGLEVVAEVTGASRWTVVDLVPGLAPDAPADRRPDTAAPFQWGDLVAAQRVVTIAAP